MTLLPLLRRTLAQARYVVIGCCCLLFLFQLVIVGQASAIEEQNSFSRLTELVPAFERLLAESGSLEAFYRRVKDLARDPSAREAYFTTAGYRRSS